MIFIAGYSRFGTKMMNQILERLGATSVIPKIYFFEERYQFNNGEYVTKKEQLNLVEKLTHNIQRHGGEQLKNGISIKIRTRSIN